MSKRIWVRGASDPEMEMIEGILRKCYERVVYAKTATGERVHSGNAYQAARPPVSGHQYDCVYAVECGGDWFGALNVWSPRYDDEEPVLTGCVRIDHHRPGDPGYGRPPSEFLPASSIGQTISELARLGLIGHLRWHSDYVIGGEKLQCGDIELLPRPPSVGRHPTYEAWVVADRYHTYLIPADIILAAAADHCLGAAYAGECPGVDPDALMAWRAESRAKFQGRSVEEVLADVERATASLEAAPPMYLEPPYDIDRFGQPSDWSGYPPVGSEGGVEVRDMRQPVPIRELPEAATRLGIGYVSGPLVGPDGRQKITCSGSASQVRAFLDHWVPAQGLVDAYGDPARGFAGAYLPAESV